MLGVVTAVGLGLVVFVSQQGWPEVFSGPIPAGPQSAVVHNDTIAASTAGPEVNAAGSLGDGEQGSSRLPRASRGDAGSGLGGSRQVGSVSPAAGTAPAASQPAPTPASAPAPTAEPVPVPVATPAPVATVPTSDGASDGSAQPAGSNPPSRGGAEKGVKGGDGDSRGASQPPAGGQVSKGSGGHSSSPSRPQAPQQKEAAPPAPEYQAPPPPPPPPPSETAGGSGSSGFKGVDKTGRVRH
jgi:hypothetical protein